jgi:hypothetical protein
VEESTGIRIKMIFYKKPLSNLLHHLVNLIKGSGMKSLRSSSSPENHDSSKVQRIVEKGGTIISTNKLRKILGVKTKT